MECDEFSFATNVVTAAVSNNNANGDRISLSLEFGVQQFFVQDFDSKINEVGQVLRLGQPVIKQLTLEVIQEDREWELWGKLLDIAKDLVNLEFIALPYVPGRVLDSLPTALSRRHNYLLPKVTTLEIGSNDKYGLLYITQ